MEYEPKKYTCYAIKNTSNGKIYIGITCDIQSRLFAHNRALINGKHHNKRLQKDYDSMHPIFTYHILEENIKESLKNKTEAKYIKKYKTHYEENGYNVSSRKKEEALYELQYGLENKFDTGEVNI